MLPRYPPTIPPMMATSAKGKICELKVVPADKRPIIPETEFNQINAAEIAAVSLMLAHPRISNSGLKIIPPPIPIRPEKKPIINPKLRERGRRRPLNNSVGLLDDLKMEGKREKGGIQN